MTTLAVVVTTYEWPEALDAVLRGLEGQSDPSFDVVVADDGSGPQTAAVIAAWRDAFGDRLTHAWQPDEGVRIARARNLGALACDADHLVFVDGDCIPRRHFVATIRRAALPGWFLAGKRVQLRDDLSRAVLRNRVPIGRWPTPVLLWRGRRSLYPWRSLTPRDRRRPWRGRLPVFAPEGNAYGFLMGIARGDFERVNGFDGRYVGWGEEDVDLAVRLGRLGLRCGFAGPGSTMLHLWHPSRAAGERRGWSLLQETLASDRCEAIEGLDALGARRISDTCRR